MTLNKNCIYVYIYKNEEYVVQKQTKQNTEAKLK